MHTITTLRKRRYNNRFNKLSAFRPFIETTFENWESEFLQMFMFVILSAFLYQKGSSESKDPDEKEEEAEENFTAKNKKDIPWPVRKGGFILLLYKYSLSIAFIILFLLSFTLHFYNFLVNI